MAFEPNEEIYNDLQFNLGLNKHPNLHLNKFGLSNEVSSAYLKLAYSNNPGSAFVSSEGDIPIRLEKIDNLTLSGGLDFIKIDIEGHEYDALLGGSKTIGKYKPVIIFEYNPQRIDANESGSNVISLLTEWEYRFYFLEKGVLKKFENLPSGILYNVIAIHPLNNFKLI